MEELRHLAVMLLATGGLVAALIMGSDCQSDKEKICIEGKAKQYELETCKGVVE